MSPKPDNPVVNIALLGAAGRMGRVVVDAARGYPGIHIGAALMRRDCVPREQTRSDLPYRAGLDEALSRCDVLLDFSAPSSTALAVEACLHARKPIIIGVTGVEPALRERISMASSVIAVLVAPNLSLGAALLARLVRIAAAVLDERFDIEITDAHHRQKKMRPRARPSHWVKRPRPGGVSRYRTTRNSDATGRAARVRLVASVSRLCAGATS